MQIDELRAVIAAMRTEAARVIVGQDDAFELLTIALFTGGGWFMFWRAMYINNLLAGGGALLLALVGAWPFTTMVGDAFALLGLGLVGAFVARWMLA